MDVYEDVFLLDCATYEDYLDSFLGAADYRFLRNVHYGRMLVELGYRSTSEIYKPEEFELRKRVVHETMFPVKKSLVLYHHGLNVQDELLVQLAQREKPNYQKIISTIIFLRRRRKSGFEITGYVDFEQSLKKANYKADDATNWRAVFQGKKMLCPKPTDLSFYDSRNNFTYYNDTDNYKVISDRVHGLMFMHKGDRKKICIDQSIEKYKKNAIRTMVYSPLYGHSFIYDHEIRKKA